MGRPRRKVGKWGRINRREVSANYWFAECRVRDHDGVSRRVRRYTPDGTRDRTGAAAERELEDHLENRARSVNAALSLESTIKQLWQAYLEKLEKEHKAPDTIARYTDASKFIMTGLGGLTVHEANDTPRLEIFLDSVRAKHGVGNAKTTRVVLSGMFGLACRFVSGFGKVNPVRETSAITAAKKKKPRTFENSEVAQLLIDVQHSCIPCPDRDKTGRPKASRYTVPTVSAYCAAADLIDPIIMLAATGLRESELLGIQKSGIDLVRKVVGIDGKVIRIPGKGLHRISYEDDPKNQSRELALPEFSIPMLRVRLTSPRKTTEDVLFASQDGTLRDPDNFNKQWRRVRAALGLEWVTSHSFRRWVFTELDNAGLTPRKVADQGGHAKPSMSQDMYMKRFTAHSENATALDLALQLGDGIAAAELQESGE